VTTVKRRPYRTGIRRGDAPELVVAAATRLFSERGYLATSIEQIAAEAGVARPTVFSSVGPKGAILKAVLDQALAGDDAPLAVAERPWWREAVEEPDAERSLRLHARNMTRISERAAGVLRALETAASVDADAAEVWEQFRAQRRRGMRAFVESLSAKTPALRWDTDTMTDALWSLASDSYWRLVRDSGWTRDRYEQWLADLLVRTFLDAPNPSVSRGRTRRRTG
jgi:AcrR family transcriptional regulator